MNRRRFLRFGAAVPVAGALAVVVGMEALKAAPKPVEVSVPSVWQLDGPILTSYTTSTSGYSYWMNLAAEPVSVEFYDSDSGMWVEA